MGAKFLLLLGPSGVGKSSIVALLRKLDDRFVYISPYITRKLRMGERDKVAVSNKKLDKLVRDKKILVVNELYGIRYATPREPIQRAFAEGKFPLLDWPIHRVDVMEQNFPERLFRIYVETDITTLTRRLEDGRDPDAKRLAAGIAELGQLYGGEFDRHIDYRVINTNGSADAVAHVIYKEYLRAIE